MDLCTISAPFGQLGMEVNGFVIQCNVQKQDFVTSYDQRVGLVAASFKSSQVRRYRTTRNRSNGQKRLRYFQQSSGKKNFCQRSTHLLRLNSAFNRLDQWFPTFVDAFLPLLILENFIPPLWNVHSPPVRVPTINYNRNNGLYWRQ